jgi:erythromycin esterase
MPCFVQSQPSAIQSWIQSHHLPFPIAQKDSAVFAQQFKDKRIVAIGEATHGSSEIFSVRNSLTQYLIEHQGFNRVAVEAPMTEVEAINRYILGLSADTVPQMKYFCYTASTTEEMKTLVEWLRQYNQTHHSKVQLFGIDITMPVSVAKNVRSFFAQYKPDAVSIADSAYSWYATPTSTERAMLQTIVGLSSERLPILQQYQKKADFVYQYLKEIAPVTTCPKEEFAWVLKNAEIMSLCIRNISLLHSSIRKGYDKDNLRDSGMAENARWILESDSLQRNKLIIFGHNAHTNFGFQEYGEQPAMGEYLKKWYRNAFYTIATGFYRGSANVWVEVLENKVRKSKLLPKEIPQAQKYSLEWYCHQVGIKSGVLLISDPLLPKNIKKYLSRPQNLHSVGATMDTGLEFFTPRNSFDAFLFIDTVSASQMLPAELRQW